MGKKKKEPIFSDDLHLELSIPIDQVKEIMKVVICDSIIDIEVDEILDLKFDQRNEGSKPGLHLCVNFTAHKIKAA